MSLILVATTVFPDIDVRTLSLALGGALLAGLVVGGILYAVRRRGQPVAPPHKPSPQGQLAYATVGSPGQA